MKMFGRVIKITKESNSLTISIRKQRQPHPCDTRARGRMFKKNKQRTKERLIREANRN